MITQKLGGENIEVSRIALGCMRMAERTVKEVQELMEVSLDADINFFDHADIYGGGRSEEIFTEAFRAAGLSRDKVILQSKCGIRDGMFDFSRRHILSSVDGILSRLKTDYIDVLLLHRPDTLWEPEEVAGAFSSLKESGKVKYFGVSNMNPGQMELLQRVLPMKIVANQLQLSLTNTGMIDSGFNVNMTVDGASVRDGGVLEYCRLNEITIQPWSPFQYGFFEGVFIGSEKYPELNEELGRIAGENGVTVSAVAVAWLLRHPAVMQPVVGTTNPQRLKDISRAADFTLSRKDWYSLYLSAGNQLP
jgi:predicted oxidoreductase